MTTLLTPREVDRVLKYPRGRSLKLAKAGKLPHTTLPDGEVRFDAEALSSFLQQSSSTAQERAEVPAHG